MKLTRPRSVTALILFAAWLTIANMTLQIWAVADGTALPVMAAMSFGQGLGVVSLLAYIAAVVLERRTLADAMRKVAGVQSALSSKPSASGSDELSPKQ